MSDQDPPHCLDCGACCHSEGELYVPLSGEDHARLTPKEQRRLTVFDGIWCYMRMEDGHCAALRVVEGRYHCTIYERRPQTCRDYDRGGEACDHDRDHWQRRQAATVLPLAPPPPPPATPAA